MNRSIILWSAVALALIVGCEKHQAPLAPPLDRERPAFDAPAPEIPADLRAKIMGEFAKSDSGALGLQKSSNVLDFIDLLGDIDNFNPDDPVDDQGMTDEGGLIVVCMGGNESEIPRFDEPEVVDRPMSIAHFFNSQFAGSLPPGSKIKDGVILFRFKGNRADVLNDFILFLSPCESAGELALPIIAMTLKDLLGGDAPGVGEIHTVTMNLRKVPVRTFSSYADFLKKIPAPGAPWHGGPDKKNFDLLKYLYNFNPFFRSHSYLDMVFVDCDLTLDYSIFAGVVDHR